MTSHLYINKKIARAACKAALFAALVAAVGACADFTDEPTPDCGAGPEASLPEAGRPEASLPDKGKADIVVAGEGILPDTGKTDSGVPDKGTTDKMVADTGVKSDSIVPDKGAPDKGKLDTGKPDTGIIPDTGVPPAGGQLTVDVWANGALVSGATVKVDCKSPHFTATVTTGATGTVVFPGLPPCTFGVEVKAPGFTAMSMAVKLAYMEHKEMGFALSKSSTGTACVVGALVPPPDTYLWCSGIGKATSLPYSMWFMEYSDTTCSTQAVQNPKVTLSGTSVVANATGDALVASHPGVTTVTWGNGTDLDQFLVEVPTTGSGCP